MRALLVVDGQSAARTAEAIASALQARGYEPRAQEPSRTFDRDVQGADLLLVGFSTQGLLRARAPDSIRSWIPRSPRMDATPTAVFGAGRSGADHALAAVADALAERGATILAVRVFPAASPTDGVVPFTDAFLEAVAERRGA
jgi:flavodoxin